MDALAANVQSASPSAAVKDLNIKALYRAGSAAYVMQNFVLASKYFQKALELDGDHKG